jgi:MFS family permease
MNNVGDGVSQIGFQVLLATRGAGPASLAAAFASGQLGLLVFATIGGGIVDRFDRSHLLVATNLARGVLFIAIGAAVGISDASLVGLVIVGQFVLGAFEVVTDGAAEALLPAIASHDEIERAAGRLGAAETAGNSFIGPPIGGILAGISVAVCFAADALTYLIAALIFSRLLLAPRRSADFRAGSLSSEPQQFFEGFRFILRHRSVRACLIVASAMAVSYSMVLSQAYLMAEDLIDIDGKWFGIVFGLEAIGFIIAGLGFGRFEVRDDRMLAGAVGLAGGGFLAIGLAPSLPILAFALLANGIGNGLIITQGMIVRIRSTPDEARGRVQTAYRSVMIASSLAGAAFGGLAMTFGTARLNATVAGVWMLAIGWAAVAALRSALIEAPERT